MKNLEFKNGMKMPALGLGTWKSEPGEVYDAVISAIKAGYRHIDCAPIYGNEKEIGDALKYVFDNNIARREELWITSKLWNDAHKKENVKPAIEKTLSDLQIDYLDLYLIHWIVAFKPGVTFPERKDEFEKPENAPITETWTGMESLVNQGLAKNIGVCNFGVGNLQLLINNSKIKPQMNQVEMHPYLTQIELREFCKSNDIHLTAYSPFGSPDRQERMKAEDEPLLFEDETILDIANKRDISPAQAILAWHLSKDIAVIPKSVNEERIRQNFEANLIELSEIEIQKIDSINTTYRYVKGDFFTYNGSPYSLEDIWK